MCLIYFIFLVFCSHVSVENDVRQMTLFYWECRRVSQAFCCGIIGLTIPITTTLPSTQNTSQLSINIYKVSRHIVTRVPWSGALRWKVQAAQMSVYCPQWPSFKPLSDFIPTPEASSFLMILLNLSDFILVTPYPPLRTNTSDTM